jgi:hypothetical protein
MGSNILGKHVSFEKIVVGPRVTVSRQNKKITATRQPDPTPNTGDAGSLTIVAYDTGPRVSVSRQTVCGLLKISHLFDNNAHGIPIVAQSHQGHVSSFLKHGYARRSYSVPR